MQNDKNMQQYRFSMTGASLVIDEFLILAKNLVEAECDFSKLSYLQINKERSTTGKRKFSELILRLRELSEKEVAFLIDTNKENQRLLIFLASVRLYRFLREFIEEVIWEKLMVYDYQLTNRDLTSFMYEKSIVYDEIRDLSENSKKKVQQVTFKHLEQAGLIDNIINKKLQIPFLDFQLQHLLTTMDKKYLLNL